MCELRIQKALTSPMVPMWHFENSTSTYMPSVRLRVYEDVEAYTRWAGKELPTEAQWEFRKFQSLCRVRMKEVRDNGGMQSLKHFR